MWFGKIGWNPICSMIECDYMWLNALGCINVNLVFVGKNIDWIKMWIKFGDLDFKGNSR